jgi:4-diphosphocytidyl-2-C-methyl-D-erythritol kinase
VTVSERAFAKLNLVLQVAPPRDDGLHPLCSLIASIDLADEITVTHSARGHDRVDCPGVPDETLCARAIAALREALPNLPPLEVRIEKRIPVAAGLGGGSADAAAVLRAGNELAGGALSEQELRELAAGIGSDVPSQVAPGHALVTGVGEQIEPLDLPPLAFVLVPQRDGLSTGEVFRELDRLEAYRDDLSPDAVRKLADAPAEQLAAALDNDLAPAALSLRPELARMLDDLRGAGAIAAAITGSGPTTFGIFDSTERAESAAAALDGAQAVAGR